MFEFKRRESLFILKTLTFILNFVNLSVLNKKEHPAECSFILFKTVELMTF